MPFVLVIIGIIVAIGFGGYYFTGSKPDTVPAETPTARVEETAPTPEVAAPDQTSATVTNENTTTAPETAVTTFKNGTYDVTTSYVAPSRTTHEVNVSLTIENDIVTDSSVSYAGETVDASSNWQKKFNEAYKTEVVGKRLDKISLSRVGGASLTTNAFNKALVEVAADARI